MPFRVSTTRFVLPLIAAFGLCSHALAAEPAPRCQLALLETLPVTYNGDYLHPTIEGSINGVPTRVEFDTSKFGSHIELAELERMGIATRNRFTRGHGVGGVEQIFSVNLKELAVGPAKGKGDFDVLDRTDDGIGAAVGADFLLRSDLEISLADRYLKFFGPINCKDQHLAYWDQNAIAIPFRIESQYNARPIFKVVINGAVMEAMISVQSSTSISTRAAKRIGITPSTPGVEEGGVVTGIGNNQLRSWQVPIATMMVGEEKISNFKIKMLDLADIADVILGRDFMLAHRIMISMSQKTLYLSYTGGEIFSGSYSSDEPWIKAELQSNNPDALYAFGMHEKAAAQGHRGASVKLAQKRFNAGDYDGTLKFIAQAQKRRPSFNLSSWAYLATVRKGDQAKAAKQLQADRDSVQTDDWDIAVVDFYLGKMDASKLMKSAQANKISKAPQCKAEYHTAQFYLMAGQKDLAKPLLLAAQSSCERSSWEYEAARADQAKIDS